MVLKFLEEIVSSSESGHKTQTSHPGMISSNCAYWLLKHRDLHITALILPHKIFVPGQLQSVIKPVLAL